MQPDVYAAGGLSESKKIAEMANAFGMRVKLCGKRASPLVGKADQ